VELRHLRYFVAVAEELSFTRAAARLHTAQPSLSQQIRQLEAEVGVPLFERSRRFVRLTSAGRTLLREAREILGRVDHAVRLASRAASGQAGEVAVGTFAGADQKILPRLRVAMAEKLPDVRLVFHSNYAVEPLTALRDGTLDLAFTRGPLDAPDLVVTELLRESILVVLPAHHRLARRRRIAVRLLDDLPFITMTRRFAPALHDVITAVAQQARLKVHPVERADNVHGHLAMVQAGLGFALLPDYVNGILPTGVITRPLDFVPAPWVSIVMAQPRSPATPAVRLVTQLVRECMSI
jgi:LysR family hca operon transcriptional activator